MIYNQLFREKKHCSFDGGRKDLQGYKAHPRQCPVRQLCSEYPYTRVKVDGTVTMYWFIQAASPVLIYLLGTLPCTLTRGYSLLVNLVWSIIPKASAFETAIFGLALLHASMRSSRWEPPTNSPIPAVIGAGDPITQKEIQHIVFFTLRSCVFGVFSFSSRSGGNIYWINREK